MEGDKNTPEGLFILPQNVFTTNGIALWRLIIQQKRVGKNLTKRKSRGEIPASAKIGGSIGIHGTWPHEDFQIDRYKNWTMGCISMKNEDVEDPV
jgi:hypothetical protein